MNWNWDSDRMNIPFKQRSTVEDAAGKITSINTDEAVGRAGVATKADDAWVHAVIDDGVDVGVDGVHGLGCWALVPVQRNALLTWRVHEVSWLASDGEEGFESLAVEDTAHLRFGSVAHEVDDEVVGVWGDETGEGGGEVVSTRVMLVERRISVIDGPDVRVVEDRVFRSVVGLCSSLVVRESVVSQQAVQVLPFVHLEETDEAVVHVRITLEIMSARFMQS